jgi:hypothetical protein
MSTETEPKFVAVLHYSVENTSGEGPLFEHWTEMLPLRGSETIDAMWQAAKFCFADRIDIHKARPMLPKPTEAPP